MAQDGNPFFCFMKSHTFSKQERLCGSKQVDRLFNQGNRGIAAFPVRLVWLLSDEPEDPAVVRILISAPKRNFHHAVDRNRIKRQIREFYRVSSAPLKDVVAQGGRSLSLAILYTGHRLIDSAELHARLGSATERLIEVLKELQK